MALPVLAAASPSLEKSSLLGALRARKPSGPGAFLGDGLLRPRPLHSAVSFSVWTALCETCTAAASTGAPPALRAALGSTGSASSGVHAGRLAPSASPPTLLGSLSGALLAAAAAPLPLMRRPNLLIFAFAPSKADAPGLLCPRALALLSCVGAVAPSLLTDTVLTAAALAVLAEADCPLAGKGPSSAISKITALAQTLYSGVGRLMLHALPSLTWMTAGAAAGSAATGRRPAVGGSAPERMRVRTPGAYSSWARISDALQSAHSPLGHLMQTVNIRQLQSHRQLGTPKHTGICG